MAHAERVAARRDLPELRLYTNAAIRGVTAYVVSQYGRRSLLGSRSVLAVAPANSGT
jgi:hypothetical protein